MGMYIKTFFIVEKFNLTCRGGGKQECTRFIGASNITAHIKDWKEVGKYPLISRMELRRCE